MTGDLKRNPWPLGRGTPARRGRARGPSTGGAGVREGIREGVRAALVVALAGLAALTAQAGTARAAASGERIQVTGEIIDTWCYLSGVMGGQDAVVGSAHHTCAMWCAAGGIPVGLLGDDGEVYMVLKWEGSDHVAGGDTILELQSDRVVADGMLHRRDGVSYIIVEKVVANEGIANHSHDDYGVVPPFAIPEPKE